MLQHTVQTPVYVPPFEAPHSSAPNDLGVLHYMRRQLYRYLDREPSLDKTTFPHVDHVVEPSGRHHRVVLMNGAVLRRGGAFAFVGFFGHKRSDADGDSLDALDQELIGEFVEYPQLLSYSSLELADGGWGNLVIMSSAEGAMHWARSERHAYATQHVAPRCYSTIRLHSGSLSTTTAGEDGLRIHRTKHFAWG